MVINKTKFRKDFDDGFNKAWKETAWFVRLFTDKLNAKSWFSTGALWSATDMNCRVQKIYNKKSR